MADSVRRRMEEMGDELQDLEKRGLFTRAEIGEIVRQRWKFEYRIHRPSPLKKDFLGYIDYEKNVDKLRDLRKRVILGELRRAEEKSELTGEEKKKKSKKWKKSISDFAGVVRIIKIYNKATMRFKADLDLWFQFLEFCRQRKHGEMKKVLLKATQFHPKVPSLWIYAAAWEFDQNLNVTGARALMQNGLRFCAKSEDLWIEYLRMELTYLNKLNARKIALGEDVRKLQMDNTTDEKWKEENKDLFMSLNEESKNFEESNTQNSVSEKKEDTIWQRGSVILQTIYHEAVKALPSNMSLQQRFLEILNMVDLARSDELKAEIMENLKKDFSHDEDFWDWMARLQIGEIADMKDLQRAEVISKVDKVVQVYEEGLEVLPTAKMFSCYAKFWSDVMSLKREDSTCITSNVGGNVPDSSSSILKVYEKAESSGCLNEDLACQYISFHLENGRLEEARNLAEKLCNGKFSDAASLWMLRGSIEIKCLVNKSTSLNKDDMHSVFELLRNVLKRLSVTKAEALWFMVMKLFSSDGNHFDKLVKILTLALLKSDGSDSEASVPIAVVNLVLQRDGIAKARELYKKFLNIPRPSLKFFKYCIELESNLNSIGDTSAVVNARDLYKLALNFYNQNIKLWTDYFLMEQKVGASEAASAVYWRAEKVLKDKVYALTVASHQFFDQC